MGAGAPGGGGISGDLIPEMPTKGKYGGTALQVDSSSSKYTLGEPLYSEQIYKFIPSESPKSISSDLGVPSVIMGELIPGWARGIP